MTEFGPAFIALIMPRSDIEILDTWYTLGMRGTDSNDIAVDNVFVPAHRTYVLSPEFKAGRHFQGPLYRFPAAPIGLYFARLWYHERLYPLIATVSALRVLCAKSYFASDTRMVT